MMKRLSEKEWKAFPINTEFRMKKQGNVPTGALVSNSILKDGIYPRIRVTSQNNGINGFTNICDDKNYRAYSNFVSMSFLGNAFYHPYTASLDMKVHCLQYKNIELKPAMGLFTVTMAERIASGTNYGNQLSSNDLAAKQILLPVDDRGNPDYAYMTLYSTEVRGGMLMRYKNFIAGQLSQLEHKDIPALDEKEWKKFKAFGDDGILDIATTSSSIDGIRLKDGQTKTLPYVTRTDNSNGIARFVSSDNLSYGYDDAGCITVGLDTQTAFWQPHDFVTGQNIPIISGKRLNQYLAQFIVPLLRSQMTAKFNWGGNGATLGRMKRLEIMLPVTDAGMPDYKYMEQYTKNMMLKKYEQYLAFIDRQTVTGEV